MRIFLLHRYRYAEQLSFSYILNRGWIDKSAHRVPKYEEVTGSNGKKRGKGDADDGAGRAEIIGETADDNEAGDFDEEEFDEVVETFESSYNFRFEEPYVDLISTSQGT